MAPVKVLTFRTLIAAEAHLLERLCWIKAFGVLLELRSCQSFDFLYAYMRDVITLTVRH